MLCQINPTLNKSRLVLTFNCFVFQGNSGRVSPNKQSLDVSSLTSRLCSPLTTPIGQRTQLTPPFMARSRNRLGSRLAKAAPL